MRRSITERAARVLDRLDAYQQATPWVGFPFAVYQRFQDDQAGNLASLLAYYTFASIFPLLLALVTVLGFVLQGQPHLETTVFHSAVGALPIISQHSALHPLMGSVPALLFGAGLAVYSGLGVAQQAQNAFNTVYDVPRKEWPGFLPTLLRSVAAVTLGGTGFLLTTLLSGAITGAGSFGLSLGLGLKVVAAVVDIVLDTALFTLLFRSLTARDLHWRDTLPGACVAALGWYGLQLGGTALVAHELKGAQSTYGTFATVIGLLAFFHIQAQLTLYALEVNVVKANRLWPRGLRSLTNVATTDADRRSYQSYAARQRFADADLEQVTVSFTDQHPPANNDADPVP